MPEKINQPTYFKRAMGRIDRELKRDAVQLAYFDAEEVLIEMYKEKNNIPVPSGWKVGDEILSEYVRRAVESETIKFSDVNAYCDAFEERFSHGYPNKAV